MTPKEHRQRHVELHESLETEYKKVQQNTSGYFRQSEIPNLEMIRLAYKASYAVEHATLERRHPLTELFADYLMQHTEARGKAGIVPVTTVLKWSAKQCTTPTDPGFHSPRKLAKPRDIPKLCQPLDFSRLPGRVATHMDLLGIGYVGELVQLTPGELWIRRNFGMKTFKVVEKMLEDMGLTFSMRLSPKAQYALERVVKERLKKSQNIWKKYDKKII
jgi:hypothetical protein